MRANYIVEDIQKILWSLFKSLSSPWTDWEIILDYPDQSVFEEFTKPFIYVEKPMIVNTFQQQGGTRSHDWEMTIGFWDDRKTGGPGEINIMTSRFIALFDNPQTLATAKFTVVLGATTTANTTLVSQGLKFKNITGPREIIKDTDLKEFRNEITVTLRT